MNSKEIIQLNNEKRELLTEENHKIYEDMLVYIRLNSDKSEQQTEEVLLELLDHLLQAQNEGKSASDIFGTDFKAYCNDIITEIPGEKTSKKAIALTYFGINFLAMFSLTYGILGFVFYHVFDLGSDLFSFSLGSGILIIVIDLCALYVFIQILLRWLKKSIFNQKQSKKWVEFVQLWFFCTFYIGIFVLISYFMPEFGAKLHVPIIVFAWIGVILYLTSFILNKKYRITK
ncbi:DUF1129 family protein [Ornithinibacillus salinisoli]|uniref:DUF1129 family protein n=1 Tax=Ornithinibacillus salinisoli TaxID=1848459 RepID=A0ABW4W3V8_9BACI